jgi:AraC family transcriptional regulator, arabinose operon regulatory protein
MAQSKQNISQPNPKRMVLGPGVMFGDVIYEPGGTFGPRVQPEVQLVLVYSGEANVLIDGAPVKIPAQTVSVLLPGHLEYFAFAKHAHTHHGWCSISSHLLSETLLQQLHDGPRNAPFSNQLHSLIQMGLNVSNDDVAPNRSIFFEMLMALGQTAMLQYALDAELLGRQAAHPRALQMARQLMDSQFSESIQITDVARYVKISPQHLGKLFRLHLGITPAQYLWQTRTKRGAELLQATGLSVADIAERCGFQNPFHFSRTIKEHYGLSPRAFRARAWAAKQNP